MKLTKNKMNIINLLFGLVLIVLSIVGLASAEIQTSDVGVKYEQEILEKFSQNETWLKVIVDLKDNSGIDFTGTKEERRNLLMQKLEWFTPIAEEILANLSAEEAKDVVNSLYWFSGEISASGFNKLIEDRRIEAIYLDKMAFFTLDKSAPLIEAPQVWNLGYTGQGVRVCVIDSGVDASHPDLSGRIIDQHCYCSFSCCPNGGIEDINANDDNGHGTNVVGIIVSQNSQYRGIAYGADIYVVKVSGSFSDIGRAIDWCRNRNVDVISISIGDRGNYPGWGTCPTYIDSQIDSAYLVNIPSIIASGNDGYINGINYPACSPHAISVGAVYDENIGGYSDSGANCSNPSTNADMITCFSNRATILDLLAPGCRISAPAMGGGIDGWCGTSQAAPHVSGTAALLLQKSPSLTPDEIRDVLQTTGKDIYDNFRSRNNGDGSYLVFERINASFAINFVCSCTNWVPGSCGAGGCSQAERLYTRTCNPQGCQAESRCVYDASCTGGGEITVCASGCNYNTIQAAVSHSNPSNRIIVTDGRTYNEHVSMTATKSGWLDCRGGARIHSPDGGGDGIYVNRGTDGIIIINCYIDSFSNGIHVVDTSHGSIKNNILRANNYGIFMEGYSADIRIDSNFVQNNNANGIRLYGSSWGGGIITNNRVINNILASNGYEGNFLHFGVNNEIGGNNISNHNNYGTHIWTDDSNSFTSVHDNKINNNGLGLFLDYSNENTVDSNAFCPSNNNVDINVRGYSPGRGDNNKCEKPGNWNDAGTTGCRYSCFASPTLTLLYPPNNAIETHANVDFICQATSIEPLVNITLYHNISGTWRANQTKMISGTNNITTFRINNIRNGTNLIWNCLAFNNRAKGSFAPSNFSLRVIIPPDSPPSVTLVSPLDNSVDNDGNVVFNCEATDDRGLTSMTLYGNWGNGWHADETKSISGTYSSVTFTKNLPNGLYKWNCLARDDASQSAFASSNWTINVSIIPNDPYKFYIKNSSGTNVAWLGSLGNIILKGRCISGGACNTPADYSFVFKNSNGDTLSYIDYNGNLCIESVNCFNQGPCIVGDGDFVIRNEQGTAVIVINSNGALCHTRELRENVGTINEYTGGGEGAVTGADKNNEKSQNSILNFLKKIFSSTKVKGGEK